MLTHTGEGVDDSADPYNGDRHIPRPGNCVCVGTSSMINKLWKKKTKRDV